MRDFGSVLKGYSAARAPFYKKGWFIGSASAVVALTIVVVLLLQKTDKPQLTEAGNTPVAEAFIKPALPGVDVQFSSYTVQSGVADTIEVASGSRIIIPPCPFVDKNGNELKGEVEIKYREMRDAVDFAISGIPMTYDSAGQKFVFESAGMFEIQGYVDGSAIQVNPACPVTVEMVPVVQDGKYNAYYLDTVNKNWEFIGKPATLVDETSQPAEPNSETIAGNSVWEDVKTESIAPKDTAWSYTQTFKNGKLIYDSRFTSWYKELKDVENAIEKHRKTEPLAPRKLSPIKNNFRILGDEELYPDIAPFINTVFEVTNSDFNTNLFSLSWNYIKIEQVNPWYDLKNRDTATTGHNDTYKIILEKNNSKKSSSVIPKAKTRHWWEFWKKKENGELSITDSTAVTDYTVGDSIKLKPINSSLYYKDISKRRKIKRELIVHPVLTDEEYVAALAVYNKKFKIYNDTLEKLLLQETVMKERITAARLNNSAVNDNTDFNGEQATGDELVDATENRRVVTGRPYTTPSDLNYGGVRVQFAASKFGIYNSDYPIPLPSASMVTINFYDKNKKEQYVDIAYQVITNRNALMCNYYYGCCNKTLKYDSKDENLLFVIFPGGKVGYVNAEDFRKIPRQGSYNITLTISEKSFKSVEEIKAFLGLNPSAV